MVSFSSVKKKNVVNENYSSIKLTLLNIMASDCDIHKPTDIGHRDLSREEKHMFYSHNTG